MFNYKFVLTDTVLKFKKNLYISSLSDLSTFPDWSNQQSLTALVTAVCILATTRVSTTPYCSSEPVGS